MKTRLIARGDCEIYFMPCAPGIPHRKEIRGYLKAHHPFFDPRSLIDCRKRTMCGKQYLMLTVATGASPDLRKSLFPPPVTTASAILSMSSWAQKNCVIHCPDEQLSFGDAPFSRFFPDSVSAGGPADLSFTSEEALLAFADREKIRQRLFTRRWKTAAVPALLLGGILLGASFMPVRTEETAETEKPVPVIAVKNESPAFWELFTSEVEALHDAGGIIEEYSFDGAQVPTNNLHVIQSDPDILTDRMGASPLFSQILIPEISFEGNILRFAVQYTARIENNGEPSVYGNPFTLIRKMRGFCADNGFTLTALDLQSGPSFSLFFEKPLFKVFMAKLKQFCETEGVNILALKLTCDGVKKNFLVRMRVSGSPVRGAGPAMRMPLPDPEMLDEVFAAAERETIAPDLPTAETGTAPIGTIQTGINRTIVFVKSDAGKISVEKRGKP